MTEEAKKDPGYTICGNIVYVSASAGISEALAKCFEEHKDKVFIFDLPPLTPEKEAAFKASMDSLYENLGKQTQESPKLKHFFITGNDPGDFDEQLRERFGKFVNFTPLSEEQRKAIDAVRKDKSANPKPSVS